MSKEHHGASVKTPRGFVDIFNAFLLKNLESYIVHYTFNDLGAKRHRNFGLLLNKGQK